MNKLTRYRLGDLIEVTRGQSLAGEYYAEEGDCKRLTLANFDYQNGGFKEDTSKTNIYYVGKIKPNCLLQEGDIITPLTEQTPGLLGSTARIPESNKYVQSGDVALIKCNEELIDPSFCYYLLPSSQVKKQLGSSSQQTKIRHTNPDAIKNCIVDIPNLEQQRLIGRFLDDISKKIACNNKQNSLLEELAQRIYEYWFVQFDFPNDNNQPYKSTGGAMSYSDILKRDIPEGWEVCRIGEIITSNRGHSYNGEDLTSEGIPMINLASFTPNGNYNTKGIKYFGGKVNPEKELSPLDLVICNTQQTAIDFKKDIIGRALFVPDIFDNKIVSSHHVTTIKCNTEEMKFFLYYLFNSDYFHKYISQHTNGTNILSLIMSGLEDFQTFIPSSDVLNKFSSLVTDIQRKISANLKDTGELEKTMSFFRPLLMSGQITLNEKHYETV
jgi:type I restriction enzyme S subunit